MIAPAKDTAAALDRLLLTIAVLQASVRPLTTGTLCKAMAERSGREWSRDTVARDLRLLMRRGLVESIGGGRGATITWRWTGSITLQTST